MNSKRHSKSTRMAESTTLQRELPTGSCQQHDLESPRALAELPELRKQGILVHDEDIITTAVPYTIGATLSGNGLAIPKLTASE
ncbi:hypothetical protein NPX13_g11389 [Xylaria arbuscula]|uniref:Uncharacterized protein n=1 Tax=Xylaria arbuscula TaxID=114810 RepID=A0A9W8TH00_9PEZI|nr:hypothetical protein NPX13_g11389 [Xylaria arbuscula]